MVEMRVVSNLKLKEQEVIGTWDGDDVYGIGVSNSSVPVPYLDDSVLYVPSGYAVCKDENDELVVGEIISE